MLHGSLVVDRSKRTDDEVNEQLRQTLPAPPFPPTALLGTAISIVAQPLPVLFTLS